MTDARFEEIMMSMDHDVIRFTVPGQPIAKGRPIAGRGFGGRVTMRTPEKTANYEALVMLAANQALAGRGPIVAPVHLELKIGVQIPASWSVKRQGMAASGEIAPTKKPDADNLLKAICDGLNGVAYADDSQIVQITLNKVYTHAPGVEVILRPLGSLAA